MNKTDVILKVSAMSGVGSSDCEKVIDALEKVLEEEIGSSGLSTGFEKFCKLLQILKIKNR